MSKTILVPYNDTVAADVVAGSLSLPAINWPADWRVSATTTSRTRLENLTTTTPGAETVQLDWSNIKDVYQGTSVERALQAPSKRGQNCRVTYRVIRRVVETDDPTWEIHIPSGGEFSWFFPISPYYGTQQAVEDLSRMIAVLKEAQLQVIDNGVESLMHRITRPAEVR
jgi:hypothetical protein